MVKAKDVGTIFLLVTEWESQQLAIASTQLCIIMSFDFFKAVLPFSVLFIFISFTEVARVDSCLWWQVSCQISRGKLQEDPPRNLVIKTIWVPPTTRVIKVILSQR